MTRDMGVGRDPAMGEKGQRVLWCRSHGCLRVKVAVTVFHTLGLPGLDTLRALDWSRMKFDRHLRPQCQP
jgi:hypothetical protein